MQARIRKKMLVASTASPYKFARSVMTAIDEKYDDELEEFALIDELEKVSKGGFRKYIRKSATD